jgi:hypothetical protein
MHLIGNAELHKLFNPVLKQVSAVQALRPLDNEIFQHHLVQTGEVADARRDAEQGRVAEIDQPDGQQMASAAPTRTVVDGMEAERFPQAVQTKVATTGQFDAAAVSVAMNQFVNEAPCHSITTRAGVDAKMAQFHAVPG